MRRRKFLRLGLGVAVGGVPLLRLASATSRAVEEGCRRGRLDHPVSMWRCDARARHRSDPAASVSRRCCTNRTRATRAAIWSWPRTAMARFRGPRRLLTCGVRHCRNWPDGARTLASSIWKPASLAATALAQGHQLPTPSAQCAMPCRGRHRLLRARQQPCAGLGAGRVLPKPSRRCVAWASRQPVPERI